MSLMKLATSALALSAMAATTAAARDQVQIAGSSTVLPYASIVAEAFGENLISHTLLLNPAAQARASSGSAKVLVKTPSILRTHPAPSAKKRSRPVPKQV